MAKFYPFTSETEHSERAYFGLPIQRAARHRPEELITLRGARTPCADMRSSLSKTLRVRSDGTSQRSEGVE